MPNSKKAHPHSLQSSRHRNRAQPMRDLRLYCGSRDQQDMWNAFSVTESALLDPILPGACRISLSGFSQNNHLEWFPREFPVLCHGLVQILEVLSGSKSPCPSMSQNARTRLLRIETLHCEGGTLPSSLEDTILANTKRAIKGRRFAFRCLVVDAKRCLKCLGLGIEIPRVFYRNFVVNGVIWEIE
jgi:hypothetical protein